MDTKTKKRISNGLKNYHHHKKVISDCKAVAGFIILMATVSILIKIVVPTALADDMARYNFLPKNADKKELTVQEKIIIIARGHGVDENYMLKLAYHESRFDQYAINVNTNGTIDRGVYQWNDYWHPEISDDCAFDLNCAIRETAKAIKAGNQHWWVADKLINLDN